MTSSLSKEPVAAESNEVKDPCRCNDQRQTPPSLGTAVKDDDNFKGLPGAKKPSDHEEIESNWGAWKIVAVIIALLLPWADHITLALSSLPASLSMLAPPQSSQPAVHLENRNYSNLLEHTTKSESSHDPKTSSAALPTGMAFYTSCQTIRVLSSMDEDEVLTFDASTTTSRVTSTITKTVLSTTLVDGCGSQIPFICERVEDRASTTADDTCSATDVPMTELYTMCRTIAVTETATPK